MKTIIDKLREVEGDLNKCANGMYSSYDLLNAILLIPSIIAEVEQQESKLVRYREALEFYAELDNWKWSAKPTDTDFILDCGSEVQRDFSKLAKQALLEE